jgi:alkylation response protein AidB-like acyl-CoA dehydrogenase
MAEVVVRQLPDRSEALAAALGGAVARLSALELGEDYDPAAPAAIVAAGLHLAPVPVEHGGLGIGPREAADVLAALAQVDGSTALGFAMHVHVVGAMVDSPGWPAGLRERLYGAIRDEGALLNAAATEEGGGSPARGALPETTATREPGGYRLTGEKTWTTWLPALRFALVTAQLAMAGESAGVPPRIGLFVVDLNSAGVTRLPGFEALGMRGSASGRLGLEGVFVPESDVVIERRADEPDPRGPAPAAWFGLAVAAVYLGVGEGARARVVRWALARRPGDGSSAVADLPTVQVRLGRIDAALRTARMVLLDVAGRWQVTPVDDRGPLLAEVALAKLAATNAAVTATDEALRVAGGPGFLAGPLERAFRDARAGLINPPIEDVALQGFARTLIERARTGTDRPGSDVG